jgi:hypothetical protein
MSTLSREEIEKEAIAIVQNEIKTWEHAYVEITDKVMFDMRELVRTCRKNYYGVFDKPYDPITKRKKIWYPLTEELVDTIAPKVKVGTKNINFRAKNKNGYTTTELVRASVNNYLLDTYFGETADDVSTAKCIDGTAVLKTWKEGKGEMKKSVKRRLVDLLNVYIDPGAESIQAAYRFTERAVMFADDVKAMTGWENTTVEPVEGLHPTDGELGMRNISTTKGVDVYEMWGKIPRYLVTGDSADTEEIDGHIVISGIEANGPKCHLIEKNTNKDKSGNIIKPYEEDRYVRVPNRWYGKGIAEKVMMLQLWMNIIINIRINRSYVAQLGLFKIRKGANITPAELSRLGSNGAVLVNSMDDIEQLVMQEASQASYTDEQNIRNIAQRITSAFEVVTGENLPASTTATNAVILQRGASSTFTGVIEKTGSFYQRWIDRHILKHVADDLGCGSTLRLLGDYDDFDKLVDRIAVYLVEDKMDKEYRKGRLPTEQQLVAAVSTAKRVLMNRKDLFIDILDDIITDSVDTHVYVTNEDLDISVMVDKLTTVLQMTPEYKEQIVPQIYDLLGLSKPELPKQTMEQPQGSLPAARPSQNATQALMSSLSQGQRDLPQPSLVG